MKKGSILNLNNLPVCYFIEIQRLSFTPKQLFNCVFPSQSLSFLDLRKGDLKVLLHTCLFQLAINFAWLD
jgi:hypothetical protein